MKYLIFTFVLASPMAWSALEMKPGLWKVDMRLKSEGKEMNPGGQPKNAMSNMPEKEKQKIMGLMGKMNSGMSPTGESNICYSKKALEKPEAMAKPNEKCETTLVTNTPNKVVSNFKCEDGTTGDATWDVKSADAMMGLVNVRDPQGKTSQITYDGKFLKADCGKVKPVL